MAEEGFRFRGESLVLDAEARSSAPGKFVELPDGITHYEIAGPPGRQSVLLVHGFSVPYYIWDPTFDALTEAGFRTLRYDLYGRGYSDRPNVVYDQDLFDRQLLSLLSALNVDLPLDLVGLSMGGPISLLFTDRRPAMVRRLCLIDPAGLSQELPLAFMLLRAPLLGEWLISLFGEKMLLAGLSDDFCKPERFPEYREKYRLQMKYAGFRRALLSTMRHGPLHDMLELYRRVGEQGRPLLLIWGREDRIVPFQLSEIAREAMPNADFHAIDDAGHVPHYERPGVVNPLLIDFLSR